MKQIKEITTKNGQKSEFVYERVQETALNNTIEIDKYHRHVILEE